MKKNDDEELQTLSQLSVEDENAFIGRVYQMLTSARDNTSQWRADARDFFDFYASKQWDDDDAQHLRDQSRVPITFNRIVKIVNTVAGLEIQNRQKVTYLPRIPAEQMDDTFADLLTNASDWVRENCDAQDEESDAFQDTIICGMGWTETKVNYEVNADGEIELNRIDPNEMCWDMGAQKRNIVDTKWRARIKNYSYSDFKMRWPTQNAAPYDFWLNNDSDPTVEDQEHLYRPPNDTDTEEEWVRKPISVIHFEWYELTDIYRVATPENNVIELTRERYMKMKDSLAQMGLRGLKQKKRIYKRAFIAGKTLLEEVTDNPIQDFVFQAITGFRDRNKRTWFGLVHLMSDPQRWANKWLSQFLHIINTSPASGIFAETGAIENIDKAADSLVKPGSITLLNPGGLGKIQAKTAANIPAGVDKLLSMSLDAISDVTGVSQELMGLAARDQPGFLEQLRQQSGVTLLAPLFDSLRRYRKESGRVMAEFIRNYISDGRLVKVVGDSQAQFVPLMRDSLNYKYDVIVDEAPYSPNMKQQVMIVMNQLMPMLQAAGVTMPPSALDYLPIPQQLINDIKQAIQAQAASPEKQMQEQMAKMNAQLELMAKQLANQKTQSEIAYNFAKSYEERAQGDNERALAVEKVTGGQIQAQNEEARANEAFYNEQVRKDIAAASEINRANIKAAATMKNNLN